MTTTPEAIANIEGHAGFDVTWRRARQRRQAPGFTAVLRVRDEARNIPWVLPGLLQSVTHVILVDNGSTDGTPQVASAVADGLDMADRLTILRYPFAVARCGSEHLHTPPDSVHSLTHFYNWSFSHVETRYALKWDGDMVLTDEGEQVLRDMAWQLEATDAIVRIPRHSLYLAGDGIAHVDLSWRNREPWGWPNRPGFTFGKGFEWEIPLQPGPIESVILPQFICFELKWLDADEFAHWSPHEFGRSMRTGRKQREVTLFIGLQRGDVAPELLPVHRDTLDHVIDVVRGRSTATWNSIASSTGIAVGGLR